jgi:hypothetical protein
LLLDQERKLVHFYPHPVYVGEFSDSDGFELMFFTGRRWALMSTGALMDKASQLNYLEDVASWFKRDDAWLLGLPSDTIAFVSKSVAQASDQGTPLGLQWCSSRYYDSNPFPFADISRPNNAVFRCGQCDSRTTPCLFEGECEADGICACKHGTSGKLCEVKPLGDGTCNPFCNTGADAYDGGDYCVKTCSSESCGVGDANYAFGQAPPRNRIGYPYCKDPSMVPLTILLNTSIDDVFLVDDPRFESYTLEIGCNDDEDLPLRVDIDPKIEGESYETIHVAEESACSLSFFGLQSWTGVNISYQVFDGTYDDSSSCLMGEGHIIEDEVVELPTLYERCLKQALVDHGVSHQNFYSGSYQDEAIEWLSDDTYAGSDCGTKPNESLIEQYALLVVSFAEEGPASSD